MPALEEPITPAPDTILHVNLIEHGGEIYLMTDRNGVVRMFGSAQEGVNLIEDVRREYHGRDHTWSMSTTINAISFRHSIVTLTTAEIAEKLVGPGPYGLSYFGNASGSHHGIICSVPGARNVYESGLKPRLLPRGC